MGNSTSQSVKNYVTNSTEYSQITREELELANKADVSTYNMQNFKLLNGTGCTNPSAAQINCDNLNITQKIDQKVDIVQEIDSNVAEKMANKLNAQAQTDIKAAMDQLQELDPGWFGEVMNSSRQELETKVKNSVKNSVTSETVMSITNEVLSTTINEQDETVSNCGIISGKNCNMGQEIANTVTVSNILSSIVDKVSENETTSDFYTKATEKLSQEQEGTVGSVMDFLKEFKWFFIIGGIIFGLLLFAFVAYKLFGSGGVPQQGFPYQFTPPMPQPQPLPPQQSQYNDYSRAQQYQPPIIM